MTTLDRMTTLTLERYRVDRANGVTANGPEKLVVLVLKANQSSVEFVVALSKLDSMLLALQLSAAASEVQADMLQGC
jgi:hypothetical protein